MASVAVGVDRDGLCRAVVEVLEIAGRLPIVQDDRHVGDPHLSRPAGYLDA
jgi:hypothetical protein